MKVLIPMLSAGSHISGVQRHAMNVARCLLAFTEVEHVHLIAGRWQRYVAQTLPVHSRLTITEVDVANTVWGRNVWFYRSLPLHALRLHADVVHLAYPAPIRKGAFRVPVVVTLHDLYPYDIPQNFGQVKALFQQLVLKRCLQRADAIACVSKSCMSRLGGRDLGVSLRKARVIPNCIEADAGYSTNVSFDVDQPFVLCVAQHRQNKNLLLLLAAFAALGRRRPELRLLIVGTSGPETPRIHRFLWQYGLEQRVTLVAGITDAELQRLYQHCEALVCLSSIEGFGMPIAEALLHGTRIVCSDIPAFREVGGTGCYYVKLPATPDEIATVIDCALRRPCPRPVALPQFSSLRVGEAYVGLYRSLLDATRSKRCAAGHAVVPEAANSL